MSKKCTVQIVSSTDGKPKHVRKLTLTTGGEEALATIEKVFAGQILQCKRKPPAREPVATA